jgi:glyoxylase-like metal-dependent hydrolase (beta-lactamase superfamily II)
MELYQTSDTSQMFTGGALETNAYLLACPQGNLLIDAPQGAAEAFREISIDLLLLTHGHFDHVWDAAAIARIHGCPVAMHATTEAMLADKNLLRRFGLDLEIEPVAASRLLRESRDQQLLGHSFHILEVPGHCPGSLCFYHPCEKSLFGGDVLFSGGVGRWDLPGGDKDLLLEGIQKKLFLLPPETHVYPGHGSATTIGQEKLFNPYLQKI